MCAYAFPKCLLKHGWDPVGLPLCYEDCIAVKLLFCFREWALIEENKHSGIAVKSRGHFQLPDCDSLPRINDTSSPCTPAKLTEMAPEEITCTANRILIFIPTCPVQQVAEYPMYGIHSFVSVLFSKKDDCQKGRGRFYQGTINVTKSGLTCQRWDRQEPHSHKSPPFVFPEVQNSENYCRNAGGEERYPWCYTTDANIRWQHCDIPRCGNNCWFRFKRDFFKSLTSSHCHEVCFRF